MDVCCALRMGGVNSARVGRIRRNVGEFCKGGGVLGKLVGVRREFGRTTKRGSGS